MAFVFTGKSLTVGHVTFYNFHCILLLAMEICVTTFRRRLIYNLVLYRVCGVTTKEQAI